MSATTQRDVDIESYIEYTIGMIVFITRISGRVFLVGFPGLAWDDVFTVMAAVSLVSFLPTYHDSPIYIYIRSNVLADEKTTCSSCGRQTW